MDRKSDKGIGLFLIVAFGIPLVCSMLMIHVGLFEKGIGHLILYGIEGMSPALAAVIVVGIKGHKEGLITFLKEKYRAHLSLKYCLLGFLVPLVVLSMAKLGSWIVLSEASMISVPSAKKWLIILWALIAEELGWRGYLQERIEEKMGPLLTPLIIGLIWTLWHYHFFIIDSMEVPLLLFAYGCIVESYGYFLITKLSKGNVVPASLWHFSGNLFFNLYLLNPNWNAGSTVPYLWVNIIYTLVIGGLYKRSTCLPFKA